MGQRGSERGLRSLLVPSQRCDWALLALLAHSFFEVKMTVVSSHEDAGGGLRNGPKPSTTTEGHLVIIAVVLIIVMLSHQFIVDVASACSVTPSLLPWHQEQQVSICLLLGSESKVVRPQLRQEGPLSPSSRRRSVPCLGRGVH